MGVLSSVLCFDTNFGTFKYTMLSAVQMLTGSMCKTVEVLTSNCHHSKLMLFYIKFTV